MYKKRDRLKTKAMHKSKDLRHDSSKAKMPAKAVKPRVAERKLMIVIKRSDKCRDLKTPVSYNSWCEGVTASQGHSEI